jgi:predicted RNase H-like HicB family nuclease
MKKHYPVIIEQDEDGLFIIQCPSFQGCRSYGQNIAEALSNIEEAILACIETGEEFDNNSTFIGVRDIEILCK